MSIFRGPKQQAITPDYRLAGPDRGQRAADPDRLGHDEARAERHLVQQLPDPFPRWRPGGKGLFNGGGNKSVARYDYSADAVIMALCEGPIYGINQIWRGQSIYMLSSLGLSLFAGTTPQAVWPYLGTEIAQGGVYTIISALLGPIFTPTQVSGQIALAYQGTAYVAAANYDLSSSATLDNHNFEVEGFRFNTGLGRPAMSAIDADPAQVGPAMT